MTLPRRSSTRSGFTLEHFDAVGRFRDEENGKPIDATGGYQTRAGETVKFAGARELADVPGRQRGGARRRSSSSCSTTWSSSRSGPTAPTTLDELRRVVRRERVQHPQAGGGDRGGDRAALHGAEDGATTERDRPRVPNAMRSDRLPRCRRRRGHPCDPISDRRPTRRTRRGPHDRTRREFVRDLGLGAAAAAVRPEPAEPRLRQPGAAQAAARRHVQPQRRRARRRSGRTRRASKFTLKESLDAARAVPGPDADPARRLRQGPRRRRQPHARHRLPAHRRRAVPRQHPGRLGHAGRLGQRHLDRPGDQELPAEGRRRRARASARWSSASWCPTGPTPGRAWSTPAPNKPIAPIDDPYQMFDKLYGRVKDRESLLASVLDDVQDDLKKVGARGQRRGPPAARRARHVRPRDGAGAAGATTARTSATRCRSSSRA